MRQGRFITAAAAAVATLAIGPGAALAAPGSFTDDAAGDFAAGTITDNAWVVEPGSVGLKGTTVADNFDGTATIGATPQAGSPPVGLHPWIATSWPGGTGTATVSGGSVTVNGARVNGDGAADYQAGKALDFRATFAAVPFQNVGLGDTFENPPWAMFSTGGGDLATGLWARTKNTAGAVKDTRLDTAGYSATVPHRYRIEWTGAAVRFYVDGNLVDTATMDLSTDPDRMRPVISDATADGSSVKVDWLNMWEIATPPTGTFVSRVFDAGTGANLTWGTLNAGAIISVPGIQTSTGNTPTPDASWSAFTSLGANGAIQSPAGRRYIQYRAALTGTAPALDSVVIHYDIGSDSTGTGGGSGTGSGSGSGGQSGGSGGSQGGGNSSTDKTKPKVTLVAATLHASKKGAVSFTYACPSTEKSCTITLKLKSGKKTVASKTFTVKGGKSKAVTVVLSKDARKLLAKRGSLKVSAVVKATDAAGNARTTTKAMTIRRATH
jgi:uncharacterized membrane protein YgcG